MMTMTNNEYRPWNDETLRALVVASDWRSVLDYSKGNTNNSYISRVWALAMTAYFGPVGLHESRTDADDRPDLSKCEDCPQVAQAMDEAVRELRHFVGAA